MTTALAYHPLANLFPLIEGGDFEEFCGGLKADGRLHEAIVLLDDMILDGRNRQRACDATGVTANYHIFNPETEGDPLAFVLAKNLHRRHLNPSQRAQIAAEAETLRHGGDRKSDQDANLHLDRAARAEQFGVSERSIATAAEVRDHGAPELVEAVKSGDVAVSAAVEIVRAMPIEDQRKLLADVAKAPDTKKAFSGVVKDLRREKQDEKRERRDTKERDLGDRIAALPDQKFGVILADPEWPFDVWSEETGQDRAAANHYPVSAIEVIKSRPVADIAAEDCVLFLWATAPKLPDALAVLDAWGFRYVTHAIWVKDRIGTGYWLRNKHEILLIGKRGSPPKPADGTQWDSAIPADVRGHSVKPDWQYELIEGYFPTLPKIELNARRARPGWTPWGLEAPDIGIPISTPDQSTPPDIAIGPVCDEPFDEETGEITNAQRPSNRDVSAGDEPSSGAGPQAEAPHAGTGSETLAGHEGHSPKGAEPSIAGVVDRDDNSAPASPGRIVEVRLYPPNKPPSATIITEGEVSDDAMRACVDMLVVEHSEIPIEAIKRVPIEDTYSVSALGPESEPTSDGGPDEVVTQPAAGDGGASAAAPTPVRIDDAGDIPTFLQAGHADNAWAKRGEGAA